MGKKKNWKISLSVNPSWNIYDGKKDKPSRAKSWIALKKLSGKNKRWKRTASLKNQYLCHYDYAGHLKKPWNLEPWKKNKGYWGFTLSGCN